MIGFHRDNSKINSKWNGRISPEIEIIIQNNSKLKT